MTNESQTREQPAPLECRAFFFPLALAAGALLAWLHLWRLNDVPGAWFRDEASIAYNAWCIHDLGCDEYGVAWPLSFRGFGNHHDPVIVYALAPTLNAKRLEAGWCRLPGAFFFLAAALAFGLLAADQLGSRWWGLVGALVFGLLPWTFAVSRTIAGGYAPMLLGMTLGWMALDRAVDRGSRGWAVVAGLAWALAMYAHHTGRPMTAILLAAYLIVHIRMVALRRSVALIFVVVMLVALAPLVGYAMKSPQFLTSRLQSISIWFDAPPASELARRFFERYLNHFSPTFLLTHGDPSPVLHTGCGGQLFASMVLPMLIGIWVALRRRRPRDWFLLSGIAVYPLASALTLDPVHGTRSLNGVPFWCLLAVAGAGELWRVGYWRRGIVLLCGLGMIVETVRYQVDYFGPYWERAAPHFEDEFQQALRIAYAHADAGAPVAIDRGAWPWPVDASHRPLLYMYALTLGRMDPKRFQASGFSDDGIRTLETESAQPGIVIRRGHNAESGAVSSDHGPPWLGSRRADLLARVPIRRTTIEYEAYNCARMKRRDYRGPPTQPSWYEVWRIH